MIGPTRAERDAAPRRRSLIVLAGLLAILPSLFGEAVAAAPTASSVSTLAIGGLVKHPLRLTAADLQKLPAQRVRVSFRGEHGIVTANFTGVSLWALLEDAGGIADPAKRGVLRHTITVTGADGYRVVISTGEIAPEFGAEPAMVAYRRDGKPLDKASLRLVMPGDKRGGRDVRDIVEIDVG